MKRALFNLSALAGAFVCLATIFFEIVALQLFLFASEAGMLSRMIPLPILAFGVVACLLGIIALMPDFEHFGDDPYRDD